LQRPLAKRGATLFERSPVRRITFNRKNADVFTAGGAIRHPQSHHRNRPADTPSFTSRCGANFWFRTSYVALTDPVPARIRQQLGKRSTVVRELQPIPTTSFGWLDDER